MSDSKYTVAPGNSFTAKGIIYQGGDEIPAAIFADKNVLASYVSDGRIIEVKAAEKTVEPVVTADENPVKKTSQKKKGA